MKKQFSLCLLLIPFFLFGQLNTKINIDHNYIWYNRTLLTISCKDCDYIPKIENAGEIIEENGLSLQLMHNGIKIIPNSYYGEDSNWMNEIIRCLRGHHEPQEEKLFYEVLKVIPDNSTMIELGSYWAYYSMWFQKDIRNAKNFLIEPNFDNLNLGKKHFEINNMNGFFFQALIGNRHSPNFAFYDNEVKKTFHIPIFSVDDFMEKQSIRRVNILHSDIQGAEYQMLIGSKNAISNKHIEFFFISTHSDMLHQRCINFLKKHHYYIIAEHTPTESYSGDGLIVASAKYHHELTNLKISKYRGSY